MYSGLLSPPAIPPICFDSSNPKLYLFSQLLGISAQRLLVTRLPPLSAIGYGLRLSFGSILTFQPQALPVGKRAFCREWRTLSRARAILRNAEAITHAGLGMGGRCPASKTCIHVFFLKPPKVVTLGNQEVRTNRERRQRKVSRCPSDLRTKVVWLPTIPTKGIVLCSFTKRSTRAEN